MAAVVGECNFDFVYQVYMLTLFTFSSAEGKSYKAAKFVGRFGFISNKLLHQWLIFRDGSLIEDATAIALALIPKEDVNEEEQMAS